MSTPWTTEQVALRLEEASATARRLPAVRVQGHFNAWPAIVREAWETMAADDPPEQHFPPSPQAVERMLEVMRWMLWLNPPARHLVWLRAGGAPWPVVCRKMGLSRTTAWRHQHAALGIIVNYLNEQKRNWA